MGILNSIKKWGKKLLNSGVSQPSVVRRMEDEKALAARSVDTVPSNRKNRAARRGAKFGNRIRCTRNHKFHAKRSNGQLEYNHATHTAVNSKINQLSRMGFNV